MTTKPKPRQLVLVAVLGAMLALLVAWQSGIPIEPATLHLASFAIALGATAVIVLFLLATPRGNQLLDFLSNTTGGNLVVLLLGGVIIVLFRGLHGSPYAAELASGILGASIGTLVPLMFD